MKRLGIVCSLLAVLVAAGGCGAQTADQKQGEIISAERELSTAETPGTGETVLAASRTNATARVLTEEEILSAYNRAVAAYEWFDLKPLPDTGETKTIDGRIYCRISTPGLENLEDLRTYLRGLFSEEIVVRLLEEDEKHPPYLEVEGALYGLPGRREKRTDRGEIRIQVKQEGDTAYVVTATVDLLDDDRITVTGMESYVFPYELVDGRWVFTNFQLLY